MAERKILAAMAAGLTLLLAFLAVLLWLAGGSHTGALPGTTWGWVMLGSIFLAHLLVLALLLTSLCQVVASRHNLESQLAEAQERLHSLTSQLCLAEERERRRIAVFLHDNISQKLAIAAIKLGQLHDAAAAQAAVSVGLDEIRQLLKQIIQDTKSLTFKISSPILYELGLEAAVEWLTEELQDQHGLTTFFEDDDQPKPLAEEVRVLLFQAVSELLMNVVKHARARKVQVAIRRENGQISISVHDDGVGFDVAAMRSRWGRRDFGFGLFSIRERLRAFGGALDIRSSFHGTTVTLWAPLRSE
ncbi:MAG: sensor histidine kinase [Desulfobacca sp.]